MKKHSPKPMTPFDELVTPPHLYSVKLMLPYLSPSMQRTFGIFLKFFELQSTFRSFTGFHASESTGSSDRILNNLRPYMSPDDLQKIDQIETLLRLMHMMQSMDGGNLSPDDLLNRMMNGEDQDAFRTCEDIFDQVLERTKPSDS